MTMRNKTLLILCVVAVAAAAVLLAASCGGGKSAAPAKTGGAVATVGNATISVDEFNDMLKRIPPFNRKRYATKAGKMELLDKLVEEELFYQEALRKGLEKDKEFEKRMEQIRRGILASMVKKDLYEADIPVTDAEIKEYYDKNLDKFENPETVKLKLILIKPKNLTDDKEKAAAKVRADQAYKKLKSGTPWEKVCDEYSDDVASKKKDGSLPAMRKGLRGEEFDNVVFKMTKKGEISEPFWDKRGWNIVQFEEKEAAKAKDFEEVKKTIERRLKQEKQKDKMDATMKQLREKANVKVNEDVLDAIPVEAAPEGGQPGQPGLPELGGGGAPGAPGAPGAAGPGANPSDAQQKVLQQLKMQPPQPNNPPPAAPKPAPAAPGATK
jgi:peptidyl-prolyl cis-trans isomerase C